MSDFMETGGLVPLSDGWFLEVETNIKFRLDEDGTPIGEDGRPLDDDYDDEDER